MANRNRGPLSLEDELLEYSQEDMSLNERASTGKKKQRKVPKGTKECEKPKGKEVEDALRDHKDEDTNNRLE